MKLHPYQVKGSSFLADRQVGYLADSPGLGKTPQAVDAAVKSGFTRGVVICPAFLRTNWVHEIKQWSGMKAAPWASTKDPLPDCDILCVSYELSISKPFLDHVSKSKPEFLVIDEAHYLKNPKAKRTRAIFGKLCRGDGMMRHFKKVWLLSGTPMLGAADDLYPWLKAFGAWEKGYWNFVDEFCTGYTGDYGFKITGNKNVPQLKKLMEPYLLRRTLSEVEVELPDLSIQNVMVDPLEIDPATPLLEELEVWEKITREILGDRKDIMRELKELNAKERDRMTAARQTVGMLKLRSYSQVLNDELYTWKKDKIVIFCIHKRVIDALRILVNGMGYNAPVIYGGTPMHKRDRIIEMFQHSDNPKNRVLICNIKAAGVGLNITQCRFVDILEPSWTPADNEQAIKRLHRIGQKKKVVARFVGLAGSIDEYVTETLARKATMINEIVG